MLNSRSLTQNRSILLFALVATLILVGTLTFALRGATVAVPGNPVANVEEPVLPVSGMPVRAVSAYGARWTGLAQTFAMRNAYAARLTGLAEHFASLNRAVDAYSARWSGLARSQRAVEAYAARLTGLWPNTSHRRTAPWTLTTPAGRVWPRRLRRRIDVRAISATYVGLAIHEYECK